MSTVPTTTDTNAVIKTQKIPVIATWNLVAGQSGDIFKCLGFNDKCVHVGGVFGGASVAIKGGNINDAAQLVALKDFDGAAITFTELGLNSVRDNIGYIQPIVTGGDGTTALVIAISME